MVSRVAKPQCGQVRTESRTIAAIAAHLRVEDGNPASIVALTSVARVALSGSNVTVAVLLLRSTFVSATPGTLPRAFLTVIGQSSQVMFWTSRTTVCEVPAHAVSGVVSNATISNLCIFVFLSVEQRCGPRHRQQAEQQHGDQPEDQALPLERSRDEALGAGCTQLWHEVELPIGQTKEEQRQPDEDGAIRFHCCQVADPRAADSKRQQEQGPDAADRRANGCHNASRERAPRIQSNHHFMPKQSKSALS